MEVTMVTMREVGKHAGVTAKTVSRVLRNDRYVSDDVRRRVLAAVDELHYVPNMLAVSFRSGHDAVIGIAVPDIADPFFAQIIQAVEVVARARRTAVVVTSLGYDPMCERDGVESLLQRRLLGLVCCPTSGDQSYLSSWLERTPMMFVDRAPAKLNADYVIEDDFGGAHTATIHMLDHRHRRIAFIGDAITTTKRRLKGYTRALADAGVSFDPDLVYLGDTDADSMGAAFEGLMGLPERPTAIFSSNARCTLTLVPLLQSRQAGMALVSFGDFPMAASLVPAVTVIDQNPAAVGQFAAERIFARIDTPERRLRRRTVLSVSLIERESCIWCADREHLPGWRHAGRVAGARM
jgi:LacI family transcriptional regulator